MPGDAKPRLLVRYRTWILVAAAVLFLPPLSFFVQFTGDQDLCGTWCPRMFFVWRSGMTWQAFLLGFLRSYMGVVLVVGMLGTTLFLGRYWCSHVCPVGAVMELGSRVVPRWLQIDDRFVPAAAFRYGYLSVYFLAAAFGVGSLCCGYCQFATVPRLLGAPFSGADLAFFLRTTGLISLGLVAMLGFLARGGRAYCNLLCPLGALDAMVNRLGAALGARRVGISPAGCNGCGRCVGHCPLWAIEVKAGKAQIDQLACMPCRRLSLPALKEPSTMARRWSDLLAASLGASTTLAGLAAAVRCDGRPCRGCTGAALGLVLAALSCRFKKHGWLVPFSVQEFRVFAESGR